jgi:arylsulfatase A
MAGSAAALCSTRQTSMAKGNQPNVIFILADDLGESQLVCYGNKLNETPNLDRLASQGMKFTQAYSAAPVCSPFRAALMTGQTPARLGITDYLRPDTPTPLARDYTTLAEVFKARGYTTGMAGKWHLSGYTTQGAPEYIGPQDQGFDEAIMTETTGIGGGDYFWPYTKIDPTGEIVKCRIPTRGRPAPLVAGKKKKAEIPSHDKAVNGKYEFQADRLALETVEFIERHKAEPFFFYMSFYYVHTTQKAPVGRVDYYAKKIGQVGETDANGYKRVPTLAAMVEILDEAVGGVMAKLDELGLAENTMVVFMSDNGGETREIAGGMTDSKLRGGKSQTYEGGIREPLIVRWPGTVKPGSVCDEPIVNTDFYPTFSEIIGHAVPASQPLDGVSIMPLLRGGKSLPPRPFFWHYPLEKPHFLGGRSSGAVRSNGWKLIEFFDDGHLELYNLNEDMGEKNNLAEKNPEKTAALLKLLRSWRKEVGAKM